MALSCDGQKSFDNYRGTVLNYFFEYIKSKINLLALAFCAASSCFWMIFLAKWYYFRYTGGWDTAYVIQTFWAINHGKQSVSILNANFFADHCHFLSFLIAPLYRIDPDPMFLQDIKLLMFFSASYIFFLILKKRLHPWMAFFAMVAFTISPANIAMLRFAFSYEAFSIPLFLLIFKAFDDKRYKLYILCCFILLLVKEQMPLVVMMFGVFAFFMRKEDRLKWALVPFLMGLIVFIAEVFIFLPYIRHKMDVNQVLYWNRYSAFGTTPKEIALFLMTHPLKVFVECFSTLNINWFNDLVWIWGILSLLSPFILLPVLPLFFKMALSSEAVEHSVIAVYYASVFTPFVFLAAWNTVNYIQGRWRTVGQSLALGLMFVHAFIFMPYWLTGLSDSSSANLLATQKFINYIPADASVLSSRKAMAHLAYRERLYQFKDYLWGYYYISGKKFVLPEDLDYILVDFSEFNGRKYRNKFRALNFNNSFTLKESIEDVALYIKNPSKKKVNRLIQMRDRPYNGMNKEGASFDESISLEDLDFPGEFSQVNRVFPVTMYWKALKRMELIYSIELKIIKSDILYYEKRKMIGSIICPTSVWDMGKYIKEDYYYLLPQLKAGSYILQLQVYDTSNQWIRCYSGTDCVEGVIRKNFRVN